MNDAVSAYLGLGSNLGDRMAHLQWAIDAVGRMEATTVVAVSPVYESGAHTLEPDGDAPDYLNAAAKISTCLSPRNLLSCLLDVERSLGRTRKPGARWRSRTIDLDVLVFGRTTVDEAGLTIPHPRLAERLFVLFPLADLDPLLHVPVPVGRTVAQLLSECRDHHPIYRLDLPLTLPNSPAG